MPQISYQYCCRCIPYTVFIGCLIVLSAIVVRQPAVLAQPQQALTVFDVSSTNEWRELNAGIQFYEDKQAALGLSDVASPAFAGRWNTFRQSSALSFGFNRSVYWLRFAVRNTTQPNYNVWLLEIPFPPLDSLDIFVPQSDGSMRLFRTGDHVPFGEREIRFRTFVVPLQLPDSLPKTLYIRVRTTSTMNVPLTIITREAMIEKGITSLLIFGIVIGVVIVLALYNLVPYIVSREQIYLRYLFYMLGAVLFVSTFNGLTAQFIFPQSGFLLQYCTLLSIGICFIGFTILIQELLQTKLIVPKLHKVLNWITYYWVILTAAGLFADYLTVNVLQVTSFLPFTVFIAFIGIRVQYKRKWEKNYYLFVNFALYFSVFTALVTTLSNLGVIPNTALTRSSTQISLIIDALIFSLALAQRFQVLRLEKTQAQEENLRLQRDQNILLQRAVDERTAQLQQRNSELASLNEEKNELMGIVAHDLKNPIGAVRSLADLVQSGIVTVEEAPVISGKIVQTADRMLELVTNLLDSNRLEAGGVQFHIVEFDIAPLVENTVWQYRAQADTKHITLHYIAETTASIVFADEQAVMQILDNLISNAVKYSPQGKNIFVRLKSKDQASFVIGHSSDDNPDAPTTNTPMTNAFLRIEVQDEGPGISEEDMKKLFGKFARLSAQPTGGEHSTGLGLSIVKKMVEAMQGRVWCESELGKGATFIVDLPCA